jgi:hypothetical protein
MLIQVIYQIDKRFGAVHKFRLESLIKSGQLFAFRRANEWIIIEKDAVRGDEGGYSGPDRRNTVSCIQKSSLVTGELDGQVLSADLELESVESECLKILESYGNW